MTGKNNGSTWDALRWLASEERGVLVLADRGIALQQLPEPQRTGWMPVGRDAQNRDLRLAPLHGRETLGDIVALSPRDLLAGIIEVTQRLLYTGEQPGTPPHPHRKIMRAASLNDSTAVIHVSVSGNFEHVSSHDAMALRMHKRAGRWYAEPAGDIASPMPAVLYLTAHVPGS